MPFNRKELTNLYKKESDPKVKERLLLVLKVKVDDMIPARVARELHRSRTWASDWLARYSKEGIEGLKNKPKSGRPFPPLSSRSSSSSSSNTGTIGKFSIALGGSDTQKLSPGRNTLKLFAVSFDAYKPDILTKTIIAVKSM